MNRRDILRGGGVAAVALPLSACADFVPRAVADLAKLNLTATEASDLYGFAKGAAQEATLLAPALGPVVTAVFAIMDPIETKVVAGIATADEVAALVAAANTVTLAVAPKVTITGHA